MQNNPGEQASQEIGPAHDGMEVTFTKGLAKLKIPRDGFTLIGENCMIQSGMIDIQKPSREIMFGAL